MSFSLPHPFYSSFSSSSFLSLSLTLPLSLSLTLSLSHTHTLFSRNSTPKERKKTHHREVHAFLVLVARLESDDVRVPAHPPHRLDLALHALGVVRQVRGDAAPGDGLDRDGVARRALPGEAGDAKRAAAEDAAEGEEVGDGRGRRGLILEDEEVLEGGLLRAGGGGGGGEGGGGESLAARGGLKFFFFFFF